MGADVVPVTFAVLVTYALRLVASAAFSPARNESGRSVEVSLKGSVFSSSSFSESSEPYSHDLGKDGPTFEFLSPKGIRIYIPNPNPSRSPYRVTVLLNINRKIVGQTADWKSEQVLQSGLRWSFTLRGVTVSQGDVLYYWVGVVFTSDTSSSEDEYSGTYTVSESHPHGIVPPPPSQGPEYSNIYENFGCKTCNSPEEFFEFMNNKNEEESNVGHEGPPQELDVDEDIKESTTQSFIKPQNEIQSCKTSSSLLKEKEMCAGEVFWLKEIDAEQYIGTNPEDAFTIYHRDNLYKSKGVIACKPTTLEATFGPHSVDHNITVDRCTSEDREKCHYSPASYLISPPVLGCRMTSKTQMTFKHGQLEVKAKLPAGEWIVSEIALEPADREYGDRSGRIVIARSRGNDQLQTGEGKDFSNRILEAGIELADEPYLFRKVLNKPWAYDYHIFKIIWTPDKLQFMVDDEEIGIIRPPQGGLDPDLRGSKMAPFDKHFYLQIGVHAGGNRDFPDNIKGKPWKNFEPKDKLKFWLARDQWLPTWKKQDSQLLMSSSVLTAIQ